MAHAHRISWEIHFGDIPDGLYVLHTCDNPPCANPVHLFLGTQRDNIDDMLRKGRSAYGHPGRQGEKAWMAKLTDDQVREIRSLYEVGRISQLALARRYGITQTTIGSIVRRATWKHI
jgi:hypothetical protein